MSSDLREEVLRYVNKWYEKLIYALIGLNVKDENFFNVINEKRQQKFKLFPPYHVQKWIKTATQLSAVLCEIQQLLIHNEHLTLRDLFYRQIQVFKNQKSCNACVAFFTQCFQLPRWRLHVISSPRGLVRGHMRFEISCDTCSQWISCSLCAEPYGVPVPAFPEQIGAMHISESVHYILVVEKETLFARVVNSNIFQSLGDGVLVTSKGFPDIATRVFLSKLSRHLIEKQQHIPFFLAFDMDPWGIAIARSYSVPQGNQAQWFLPEDLHYPKYNCISCTAEEAIWRWKVSSQEVHDLTKKEKAVLKALLTTSSSKTHDAESNPSLSEVQILKHQPLAYPGNRFPSMTWRDTCKLMLRTNKRFELDAIEDLVGLLSGFMGCWV